MSAAGELAPRGYQLRHTRKGVSQVEVDAGEERCPALRAKIDRFWKAVIPDLPQHVAIAVVDNEGGCSLPRASSRTVRLRYLVSSIRRLTCRQLCLG